MPRIDWQALSAEYRAAAALPTSTRYQARKLTYYADLIDRELRHRAAGRRARLPLSVDRRRFAATLMAESRERAAAAAAAPAARDDAGNILVDADATPWEPTDVLAPVRRIWLVSPDAEQRRQCVEMVRAYLSTPDALADWLAETAEQSGCSVAQLTERLDLSRAVLRGCITSNAQAERVLRHTPVVWTVHAISAARVGAWGYTQAVTLRSPDGGLVIWWASLTAANATPTWRRGRELYHVDLQVGQRVGLQMAVKSWGDGERYVTAGKSYPSKTTITRVVPVDLKTGEKVFK